MQCRLIVTTRLSSKRFALKEWRPSLVSETRAETRHWHCIHKISKVFQMKHISDSCRQVFSRETLLSPAADATSQKLSVWLRRLTTAPWCCSQCTWNWQNNRMPWYPLHIIHFEKLPSWASFFQPCISTTQSLAPGQSGLSDDLALSGLSLSVWSRNHPMSQKSKGCCGAKHIS